MSHEASSWFKQLEALGQSQGFLTYAQVNDVLPVSIVDPEAIAGIVEQFKRLGIRVVPHSSASGVSR
jgi:RNA polymerase primary sigma factor